IGSRRFTRAANVFAELRFPVAVVAFIERRRCHQHCTCLPLLASVCTSTLVRFSPSAISCNFAATRRDLIRTLIVRWRACDFGCFLLFPLRIFKASRLLSTRPDNQCLSDSRLFVCITYA